MQQQSTNSQIFPQALKKIITAGVFLVYVTPVTLKWGDAILE